MALHGDDEINSLLAVMGSGGQASTTAASASSTRSSVGSDGSDGTRIKEKAKKLKKKGRHNAKEGDPDAARRKKSRRKNREGTSSFVGTRLSRSCFQWPRSDDERRRLRLGRGLSHDCEGYVCGGEGEEGGRYGSGKCRSCGKSAAAHELRLSPRSEGGGDGASKHANRHPPSIMSIAKIIVASRNVRCLMGEYHATSNNDRQGGRRSQTKMHQQSKGALLPPLNSTSASSSMISANLDSFVGNVLEALRDMQSSNFEINRRHDRKDGVMASIPASDIQLLREKVSALVNDAQGYKEIMNAACTAVKASTGNDAAIDLVERRLAAVASCDAVYYRCYYAAIVFFDPSARADGERSDLAAMIPHPPTYFSCPGLAWDAFDAGAGSLRAFTDGTSDGDHDHNPAAAPLDDATRRVLLESWGLGKRLSSASVNPDGNPLLALWQSRFLETVRHMWTTRYSAVKSSIALREPADGIKGSQLACNNGQGSRLKIHETVALSPAVTQWRDSVRDYPANFYAYAAPTNEALQAILNCLRSSGIGQLVEAGAGTGYWSALLLSHLKRSGKEGDRPEEGDTTPIDVPSVVPYDIAPPSSATRGGGDNEYHGNIPTFTDVRRATALSQAFSASVTTGAKTALLICYPPPSSDMARGALSAHIANGGRTVMHIGEWRGLTGDAAFEALLTRNFSCREWGVTPLPLWGTDAAYLTVWKKKDGEENGNARDAAGDDSYSPALGYCFIDRCAERARRRCRYARPLQYCSRECYLKDSARRRAVLALHMISSRTLEGDESMKYEEDCHFMNLDDIATSNIESNDSSGNARKRRKKKRRRR